MNRLCFILLGVAACGNGTIDLDPSLVDDDTSTDTPKDALPTLNASVNDGEQFSLSFTNEFNTGNLLPRDSFRHETMDGINGREHRVPYIDKNSEQELGRRHAAWYNEYRDQTSYIDSSKGHLVQRGLIDYSKSEDDRRSSYSDRDGAGTGPNGEIEFGDFRLYSSWIDTFEYDVDEDGKRSPSTGTPLYQGAPIQFEPGTYFEIRVNFENMNTTGHRHSFWLMPVNLDPSNISAYDDNPKTGAEIDIYEHEFSERTDSEGRSDPLTSMNNNLLYMKTIAGDTLSTDNETDAYSDFEPYNDKRTAVYAPGVSQGWHTFGLYWTANELVWFVDGQEVVRDTNLVPEVPMYMIISREMNTGVNNDPVPDNNRPKDPGLQGENIGLQKNLGKFNEPGDMELYKNGAPQDHVLVDYVRTWKIE